MNVNILLINKLEGFIVTESFNTNIFRLVVFCLSVEIFRNWMKSKTERILTFIPFLFDFMNSVIHCHSLRMFKQIRFEKDLIKRNDQFWKFYFIEVDILEDKNNKFKKSFLFKLMKFLSRFYLKCPKDSINFQKF